MIVSERTKNESGHWYTLTGEPAYTIKGSNGAERNTTLRDARKLSLLPSVTGVLALAAKPALINWMIDQAIMAALTLPRQDEESEESYLKRIKDDSKQQGLKAAERGTEIHNAIEDSFLGNPVSEEMQPFVDGTRQALLKAYGSVQWIPEESFGHPKGFGGRVDIHVKPCDAFPNGLVIDIKTKDFVDPAKATGYDEHLWQLAAYREGLKMPKAEAANIFVARNRPGLVHIHTWSLDELDHGWNCFALLCEFWQAKNNYIPGIS